MDNPSLNEASLAEIDSRYGQDYDALRRGAGICVLENRLLVRVVGDDRVSFLNGMCSNDIKSASAGDVIPALFLTEHAHLIADFFAWIENDAILIDIDAELWNRARSHLEKLLVADDVEFEEAHDAAVIDIGGPHAASAARAAANISPDALDASLDPLEPWKFIRAGDLLIGRVPRLGSEAVSIIASSAIGAEIAAKAVSRGGNFRAVCAGARETVRVENGLAQVGVDTTEKTIALEARLSRSISFSKGCYVGQETIERATARGGVRKKLYGLRFEGGQVPERSSAVMLDGKEVGRVSSAVYSPRFGAIGLSILHHSAWHEGIAVKIQAAGGEIEARVADLPFYN